MISKPGAFLLFSPRALTHSFADKIARAADRGHGSETLIIEWHTHVYPPEEAGDEPTWDGKSGPGWAGRCPMTVENVLDAHYKAGIDISVVSNAAHYMRGKPVDEELVAI